jgi:hypothetical protein
MKIIIRKTNEWSVKGIHPANKGLPKAVSNDGFG